MNEFYMKKCIEIAKQGEGNVAPNPLVGCVVLDGNNNVVGEDYHQKFGEAHAEVNALNMVGEKAKDGTLFVSLEPCSHHGKTPPCADRIIKEGLKKVVVGMKDPNPLVAGKGIKKLREAGIEVEVGVLEDECKKLNEIFIKNITKKEPFVAIKTASTLDGKIATKIKSSKWITSSAAREEVQRQRNKYDAILTGSGTVLADNPSLTCRMENGRNPVRVIIDSQAKTDASSKVYNNDKTRVILAVSENIKEEKLIKYSKNVEILKCSLVEGKIDLKYLIQKLYKLGINSILVEAGGILNGAFAKANLIDKFYFFVAPKILGDERGLSNFSGGDVNDINDSLNLQFADVKHFPPDIMIEAYK